MHLQPNDPQTHSSSSSRHRGVYLVICILAIAVAIAVWSWHVRTKAFQGSVQRLYEAGMVRPAEIENYEAWVVQDRGVEVLITNMSCNPDGKGPLLFGKFSMNGVDEKACWKLEERGVGIVSLSGQAKRIQPGLFQVETINGQPVNTPSVSTKPPAPPATIVPPVPVPVQAAPQVEVKKNLPLTASALVDLWETSTYKNLRVDCPSAYSGIALNELFMSNLRTDFVAKGKDWFAEKMSPRWMMNPYMAYQSERPMGGDANGKHTQAEIADFNTENSKPWKDCVKVDGKTYAVFIANQPHNYSRQSIAMTALPSETYIYSENYDGDYSVFVGDLKKIQPLLEKLGYR